MQEPAIETEIYPIVLGEESRAFRAPDGSELVYLVSHPYRSCGQVFYRPAGGQFVELVDVEQLGGPYAECKIMVSDPHNDWRGVLRYVGGNVVLDGDVTFSKIVEPDMVEVLRFRRKRVIEYFCQLRDDPDTYVYVSGDDHPLDYGTFRVTVGCNGRMHTRPVTRVERHTDGGTTYIHTDSETMFFPRPGSDANPWWGSAELVRADPNDFVISETRQGVSIRPKVPDAKLVEPLAEQLLGLLYKRQASGSKVIWVRDPGDGEDEYLAWARIDGSWLEIDFLDGKVARFHGDVALRLIAVGKTVDGDEGSSSSPPAS